MPTPEAAAAFAKLAAAREHLNRITAMLNQAQSPPTQIARHRELCDDWDVAYREFQKATEDFARAVANIRPPAA